MFGLFKRNNNNMMTHEDSAALNDTGIHYHAGLIDQFKAEHRELMHLFVVIKEAAEDQDFNRARKNLKKFTSILRSHLLDESVKLYVYLSRELECDDENKQIILAFRREMMKIGRAVNQFVTLYNRDEWSSRMEMNFLPELLSIGNVLIRRIQREESTLYPLYMPENYYQ